MREAMFYEKLNNNKVKCTLCPHNCVLTEGKVGICRVRHNENGILYTDTYGIVSAISLDRVEKKPLYHYHPGKKILSIGSIGCNMTCTFCQNWQISQINTKLDYNIRSSDEILKISMTNSDNIGVAYTYNEATVFYEYMYELAKKVKKNGMKNVMVTNGLINKEPLLKLIKYIDACNIDLKAFNNKFYKEICNGDLEAVKQTLLILKENGIYFEISNLIIPGKNDNEKEFEEMTLWVKEELGENTVLHINRYYPNYKMKLPPTDEQSLYRLYEIASKHLRYVYIGNLSTQIGQDTYCSKCGTKLIERSMGTLKILGLDSNGDCIICKNPVCKCE